MNSKEKLRELIKHNFEKETNNNYQSGREKAVKDYVTPIAEEVMGYLIELESKVFIYEQAMQNSNFKALVVKKTKEVEE